MFVERAWPDKMSDPRRRSRFSHRRAAAAMKIFVFSASLLLALSFGPAGAEEITNLIEDCGSTRANITKVTMEGCDHLLDTECKVEKGGFAKGRLEFNATEKIDKMVCVLNGDVTGTGMFLPLPSGYEKDGCKSLVGDVKCPIEKDQKAQYEVSLEIQSVFPTGSVVGKWMLKDGQEDEICFTIPIKIIEAADTDNSTSTSKKPDASTPPDNPSDGDGDAANKPAAFGILVAVMVMLPRL